MYFVYYFVFYTEIDLTSGTASALYTNNDFLPEYAIDGDINPAMSENSCWKNGKYMRIPSISL